MYSAELRILALITLITVTLFILARGFAKRDGYLQYPFLAAAVVAGWFIPQTIGLLDDPLLPQNSYVLTLFYASACLISVLIGFSSAKPKPKQTQDNFDKNRLLIGAGVLSAIGIAAFSATMNVEAQKTQEGLTTGIITILFFFAQLMYFGFALSLMIFLRTKSVIALVIMLIVLNTIMGFVLFGGRRGPAVAVVMITLSLLWFERRILVPKIIIFGSLIAGAVFVPLAGEYRRLVQTINSESASGQARLPSLSEILSLDFTDGIQRALSSGSYEARNAITYVSAAFESGQYDFGLSYWNYLIFRYIPGQIIGHGNKQAIMFELQDLSVTEYGYARHIGTTFTGFADTFTSFSFAGVLLFAGLGYLLSRMWNAAVLGSLEARIYYAISLSFAMEAITHSMMWYVAFLPQLFVFLIPIFFWARKRSARLPPNSSFRDQNQNPYQNVGIYPGAQY